MLQAEHTTNRDGDEFFHVGGRVHDVVSKADAEIIGIASEGVVKLRYDDDGQELDVTVNYLFTI